MSQLKFKLLYRDDIEADPSSSVETSAPPLKVYSGSDYTFDEATGELIVSITFNKLTTKKIKHLL